MWGETFRKREELLRESKRVYRKHLRTVLLESRESKAWSGGYGAPSPD